MIRLSSADTEATEQAEGETDERREALLVELREHLGDAVLDSHIAPGRQLWIRVDAASWLTTFRHLRDDHGFRFFDFLSAIDWMPSPYGRYEDAAVDVEGGPARPGPSAGRPSAAALQSGLVEPPAAKGATTGATKGEVRPSAPKDGAKGEGEAG